MKRIVTTLLTITVLSFVSMADVKPVPLKTIGVVDGLPSSFVNAAWQDEFGMMWIGTKDGLVRYDGKNMRVFHQTGRPGGLYNNNIKAITGNGNGELYVIAKFALCIYDMKEDSFTTVRTGGIRSVFYDGTDLWAASSDSVFCLKEKRLEAVCGCPGAGEDINAVVHNGTNLIFGTDKNLYKLDSSGKASVFLGDVSVFSLCRDTKNNIWVCTRNDGAWLIPLDGNPVHLHIGGPAGQSLSSNFVKTVCEDSYGLYWIGTTEDINIYRPLQNNVSVVKFPSSLSYIFCDNKNSLWVCSTGGISIWNKEFFIFKDLSSIYTEYNGVSVSSMVFNPVDKVLLVGTEKHGILEYDPATSAFKKPHIPGCDGNINIRSLVYDPETGNLYVCTQFSGLYSVNLKTKKSRGYFPGGEANIIDVVPYGADSLLVATWKGTNVISLATGDGHPACSHPEFAAKYATSVFIDSRKCSWTATSMGLLRKNLVTGEENAFFLEDDSLLGTCYISCFYEDSKGDVWMGTSGAGLIKYDCRSSEFSVYSTGNSAIPSDYIIGVSETPDGYIQAASSTGYFKYNVSDNVFHVFSRSTMFPVTDVSECCFCLGGTKIVLAGNDGMYAFDEEDLRPSAAPGDVYFVSIRIDGGEAENLLYKDRIDLKDTHFILSIRTSSPDYLSDNNILYRVREHGDAYIAAEAGSIVLTNLPAGTYHLDIQAVGQSSSSQYASRTLVIKVHRKWYRSIVMICLYLSVLLWAVALVVANLGRKVKRNIQKRYDDIRAREIALAQAEAKRDKDFIEMARNVVLNNLTNSEFGVDEFAREMAIGRTALFSRIKEITGDTPNRFIVSVKLEKARSILETKPEITTSELAYISGFCSPSYFIKTFKGEYGITPTAYKHKVNSTTFQNLPSK